MAIGTLGPRLVALIGIVVASGAACSKGVIRQRPWPTLRVPVSGVDVRELADTFYAPRDGDRIHRAIDILAPRGTLVVAATGGRVERIFSSTNGGLGVYQRDDTGTRCFYYAHLDGYARGLEVGQRVTAGDAIGYVGTTGNAPDHLPHLHFQVLSLSETRRCADGRAINPMALFR